MQLHRSCIILILLYRRVCPGKRVADSSLFISIAMLVAVFDIKKAKDETGREIVPKYEYSPGAVRYDCRFISHIYNGI